LGKSARGSLGKSVGFGFSYPFLVPAQAFCALIYHSFFVHLGLVQRVLTQGCCTSGWPTCSASLIISGLPTFVRFGRPQWCRQGWFELIKERYGEKKRGMGGSELFF